MSQPDRRQALEVPLLQRWLACIEGQEFEQLRARGIRSGPEWDDVAARAKELRVELFERTGDWYGRPKQPKPARPTDDELEARYDAPEDVPQHVREWVRRHAGLLTSDATDAVRWARIVDTLRDERYPVGEITIFRAVAAGDDIRPGDWVTTERQYADEHLRRYIGRGHVLEETVDGRDVLMSPTGNPEEAIYAPRALSGPLVRPRRTSDAVATEAVDTGAMTIWFDATSAAFADVGVEVEIRHVLAQGAAMVARAETGELRDTNGQVVGRVAWAASAGGDPPRPGGVEMLVYEASPQAARSIERAAGPIGLGETIVVLESEGGGSPCGLAVQSVGTRPGRVLVARNASDSECEPP